MATIATLKAELEAMQQRIEEGRRLTQEDFRMIEERFDAATASFLSSMNDAVSVFGSEMAQIKQNIRGSFTAQLEADQDVIGVPAVNKPETLAGPVALAAE